MPSTWCRCGRMGRRTPSSAPQHDSHVLQIYSCPHIGIRVRRVSRRTTCANHHRAKTRHNPNIESRSNIVFHRWSSGYSSFPFRTARLVFLSLVHHEASTPHLVHTTPTTNDRRRRSRRDKHKKSLRPLVILRLVHPFPKAHLAMPLSLASNAAPSAFSSGSAVSSVSSEGPVPSTTPLYEGAGEGAVVSSAVPVAMATDALSHSRRTCPEGDAAGLANGGHGEERDTKQAEENVPAAKSVDNAANKWVAPPSTFDNMEHLGRDETTPLLTSINSHTPQETTAGTAKSQSMDTHAQSTTPTDMSEGVKGRCQSVGFSPTSVEEDPTSPQSRLGTGRMGLHTARLLAATMASKERMGMLGMQASTVRTSTSESTSPTTHPFHSASAGEGGIDGSGARGSGPCPGPDPTPSAGARATPGASAPATIAPQSELALSLVSQLRGKDRVQAQGQDQEQRDGPRMVQGQGQGQGPGQPPTGHGQSEQVRLWHCS